LQCGRCQVRVQQLTTIAQYLKELPERPVALVGDLNTVDTDKPELDILRRAGMYDTWGSVGGGSGATMPSHEPISRLDYIWLGPGLDPQDAELIGADPDHDGYYPSDHLGVLAVSQFGGD
jgi:endonuclease/exonuclease/phosphatase family metal-dependent hydrolase